jgi:hypothetical protein
VIAALYVQTNGVYYGLPDVDPWDETRDARLYDGPWPVVAHPPCNRWSRLAGVCQEVHYDGEDGGCFAARSPAVRTVRRRARASRALARLVTVRPAGDRAAGMAGAARR